MHLRPLPRSLDPLPLESLPGYVLRLAHRLDSDPARIAALTGLSTYPHNTLPSSHMLALDATTAAAFGRATRLSPEEVAALTLDRFTSRYPPLDPDFCGRQRTVRGLPIKETWVFFRASRYCPDCLAGDGSTIQQRHGGPWNLLWRLPIVFACPVHHRLLEHACPGCHQLVHHRARKSSSQLLSMVRHVGLHPAQCRNTVATTGGNRPTRVCGTRLDTPSTTGDPRSPNQLPALLRLQQRLLGNLNSTDATPVTSLQQPTTPQRYLIDLRILCCLITASWPAAPDLVEPHARASIDEHHRTARESIRAIRRAGRTVRELAFFDAPPMDTVSCANLFAAADHTLATHDEDTLRDVIRPLIANAPAGINIWLRQFLPGDGYCSRGLQTVVGIEAGNRKVRTRLGLPPERPAPPTPPPRAGLRFDLRHIPPFLLPDWYAEHLAHFADAVKPRLLRRAAATRLAQLCVGGHPTAAARQLGIPRFAAKNALRCVEEQLSRRHQREFDAAINTLAEHLNTTDLRTDYGARRRALATWSLSTEEWTTMTSDLQKDPRFDREGRWDSPFVDWGDSKRILASIWVWVRITQGEHSFSPAVRPDLDQPRPSAFDKSIFSRWPRIGASQLRGHYAELRARLDPYADELATRIDHAATEATTTSAN